MPITQERILSLLAAAVDYQQALERYWIIAQSTRQRVGAGQLTPQQGFDLLAIETRPEWLLQHSYDSPAVIKLEQLHFKREAKRNTRKAAKARENRDADKRGEPRPDRGNGREYGILGAGRTVLEKNLQLAPDPNILLRAAQATQSKPKPNYSNTDADQISADTELDFGTPPVAPAVKGFFDQLDENGNRRSPDLPSKS